MNRITTIVGILFFFTAACGNPTTAEREGSASTPPPGVPAESQEGPPPLDLGPVTPGEAPPHMYSDEQIERGKFLVRFGGCNDCHTPWTFNEQIGMPVPDMRRMLSGHPESGPDPVGTIGPGDMALIGPTFTSFALPFGIVYSMNLTPDINTGTGTWTEQMFVDIFRKGKHLGGDARPVLPPMPWPPFRTLPDEDLIAIFAYLRSIPPITNFVPSPKVPEEALWQIAESNRRLIEAMESQ